MPPDTSYLNKLTLAIQKWKKKKSVKLIEDGKDDGITDDYISFAAFIGYPNPKLDGSWIVDISKPEIQQIIDLINGPHGNTVLKIMEVRFNDVNK